MNILLKAATILDPTSPHHKKIADILVQNGTIVKIAATIDSRDNQKEIVLDNLHVSQGWFDSSVSFGEPGYEERETISNGLQVAARSGFTGIALNPNTKPVTDNSGSVGYLLSKAADHPVSIQPIGTLTAKANGTELAELYDMKQAGAVAFGDYKKAIENPNLLKIALQYVQSFDGLILSFPQNNQIAGKGIVNEEEQSTLLGLKGIPALAEELQISRDLFLLEYTGGRLHIPTISTKKSVDLIRKAKTQGLQVSCSTSVHHLSLTDTNLDTFDTSYKVLPPLRTNEDLKALLAGIEDGTIDMVTSDHQPMDVEHKKVEFDNAKYGTIGLESTFGVLSTILTIEKVIAMLTNGKKVFGVEQYSIVEGNIADLSLFNPNGSSEFTEKQILSTSKNSAFIGTKTKGQVYGILAKGKPVIT